MTLGASAAQQWLLQGLPHLAIGLDAVLQAVELPAGVSDLDAGLADVDGDHLTHGCCFSLLAERKRGAESLFGRTKGIRSTGCNDRRPENGDQAAGRRPRRGSEFKRWKSGGRVGGTGLGDAVELMRVAIAGKMRFSFSAVPMRGGLCSTGVGPPDDLVAEPSACCFWDGKRCFEIQMITEFLQVVVLICRAGAGGAGSVWVLLCVFWRGGQTLVRSM